MTTPTFQIAIDCMEPHGLNRFWAAVMGYEIEDHDELIHQLMDSGYVTEADVTTIDGRLAFTTAAACRDPQGIQPRLLFQQVPERKEVKNRLHLDLHIGEEKRPAEIQRLIGLGAKELWDGRQGPQTWVTMADPEGNEFCVA